MPTRHSDTTFGTMDLEGPSPEPIGVVAGRRVGGFVLRSLLDEAGFGQVWLADQPSLRREVAVKVLHPHLLAHRTAVERFLQEARLASRLDHPLAAHVYDAAEESDGTVWIAMEYVRGTSLARWLGEHGSMPLSDFLPFLGRLAEVVHAAHEHGIIHRDIKPGNVMVRSVAGRLVPTLLDFGVARVTLDPNPAPGITLPGALVGTPAYMSPEAWAGVAVGPAADQYSLAVLAWEVITGRRPFLQQDLHGLAVAHRSHSPPPMGAKFSTAIEAQLRRALDKDADRRFPDVLAFSEALRRSGGDSEETEERPVVGVARGDEDGWDVTPCVRHLLAEPIPPDVVRSVLHACRQLRGAGPRADDAPLPVLLDVLSGGARDVVEQFMARHAARVEAIRVAIAREPRTDGTLQIVALNRTADGALDLCLRNLADDTTVVTRIVVSVVSFRAHLRGMLEVSARYDLPIDGLAVGESAALAVMHSIDPRRADRFQVALGTSRVLGLRVTLHYNGGLAVSDRLLWDGTGT